MLLSTKHRFIFIKTMKAAGTSLQLCLAKYLRERHDIITPVFDDGNEIYPQKKGVNYYPGRNYAKPGVNKNTWNGEEMQFWGLMSAQQIKERLPEDVWNSYTKITAERHPYEKVISMAWYIFPWQERYATFSGLLDRVVANGDYENWSRYSIDGKNVADVVVRYEHLLEDTNAMLNRFGLRPVKSLPSIKTQFRQDKRAGAEVLSLNQKSHIQQVCAKEFEYYAYPY